MLQQDENTQLDTILNSVSDGVFMVDEHWRITLFNRSAQIITGIQATDAIGKKCSDVFHADICERGCALRRSLDTGEEQNDIHARILNVKGQSVPLTVNTVVVTDKKGRMIKGVETFTDISMLENLRTEIQQKYSFGDMAGKSKPFIKILASLPDLARSDSAVLIEGPQGTGKHLMAKVIHNLSPRHKKQFMSIDCETLSANIIDAELFGYEQGALSEAKKDKPGKLALAQGSTLYLDGIENLSPATQVKLLRVLQEREYEPLGSTHTERTDVRIIAAARTKLSGLITGGEFRDDLYFRLAAVHLYLPPLQNRRTDIPLLVQRFIRQFNAELGKNINGVDHEVSQYLMQYDYPGNISELKSMIEYACTVCKTDGKSGPISTEHLPPDFRFRMARIKNAHGQVFKSHASSQEEAVRQAIRQADGHLGNAAKLLGVSRTTLWRKMKRLGMSTGDAKGV